MSVGTWGKRRLYGQIGLGNCRLNKVNLKWTHLFTVELLSSPITLNVFFEVSTKYLMYRSSKVFERRFSLGPEKAEPKEKLCSTGSISRKSFQRTGIRDRE